MSCDPKITIRVWGFDGFGSESLRASTMARPMPLESNLSQWMRLDSGSGVLGVFDSDQKGFRRPKNGFVSRMEVGLITASVSETDFEVKLVNNLGFAKIEEVGFVGFSLGERRELVSAIGARLLALVLQNSCKNPLDLKL